MTKSKRLIAYIINLIPAILICYSLVNALLLPTHITIEAYKIIPSISALLVLFSIVFYNKKSIIVSSLVLLVSTLSYSVYAYFKNFLYSNIENITAFFKWIYYYIVKDEVINNHYVNICCVIVFIIITLIIYLFTIKNNNFYIPLIGGFSIFAFQWIYDYFYSLPTFYLFVFLIIFYYIKHIYNKSPFNENSSSFAGSAIFIWAAPVCALILYASSSIPVKDNPIEWKWLDTKINRLYNYATGGNYITMDNFSISMVGFGQNSGKLGGTVQESNIHVLDVESPRSLYLRGTVKNDYSGNAWRNSIVDIQNESLYSNYDLSLDYNQTLKAYKYLDNYNVFSYLPANSRESSRLRNLLDDKERYENFIDKCFYNDKIRVTYRNIKSKVLFVPLKTYWIDVLTLKPFDYMTSFTGDIISKKSSSNNFTYYMDSYTLKANSNELKALLRSSKVGVFHDNLITYMMAHPILKDCLDMDNPRSPEINYEKLNNTIIASNVFDDEIMSLIKDEGYSNMIYNLYTQLPGTIPQRVYDLTRDITNEYNNNYDKVKAIETYLSKNSKFLYTLMPKDVPEGRDFVDYFLFESKEGYCTYYATAMAVMARTLGIPSRYIEGFALPQKPIVDTTTYKVTSMNAHAWVEIYFEGFGWVTFEPTSAFTSDFYNIDFRKDYKPYSPSGGAKPYTTYSPIQTDDDANLLGDETKKYDKLIKLIIIFTLIIVFIFILILFNAFKRKYMLHKYLKLEGRKSVLSLYKFYIKVLAINGFKIYPGETPGVFSKRVDGALYFSQEKFSDVTNIFLSARYSLNEISNDDKEKVHNFYKTINGLTKRELNKFNYLLYKYILGLL